MMQFILRNCDVDWTKLKLVIRRARLSFSGRHACVPNYISRVVHVLALIRYLVAERPLTVVFSSENVFLLLLFLKKGVARCKMLFLALWFKK